jgi:hypothetical protein
VRAFLTQSSSDLRDGNRSDKREGEESALRDKESESYSNCAVHDKNQRPKKLVDQ